MNLEESYVCGVVCDNMICDERGDRDNCYRHRGKDTYLDCDKYTYWKIFKDRHDRME